MAIINITIPFLLITWAEQSVESSLAAILTSPVPLFAIVLSALFLPTSRSGSTALVGLLVGFIGVVIITSRGPDRRGSSVTGEIALLGAALSYAAGAVYSRRNVRGLAPMIPAVFQVTFALLITGTIALLFEHPWTATPDAQAIFSILWLGLLGSGWPISRVPPVRPLGRHADHARGLPAPGRRDRPRLPRPAGAGRRPAHHRDRAGHRRGRRWSTAGSGGGGCSGACRRSRRPEGRRSRALSLADGEQQRPADDQHRRPDPPRRPRPVGRLAQPDRAPRSGEDRRRLAQRRHADNGATLSATRMHRYAAERQPAADRRPPDLLRPAAKMPPPATNATHTTSTTDAVTHRIAA